MKTNTNVSGNTNNKGVSMRDQVLKIRKALGRRVTDTEERAQEKKKRDVLEMMYSKAEYQLNEMLHEEKQQEQVQSYFVSLMEGINAGSDLYGRPIIEWGKGISRGKSSEHVNETLAGISTLGRPKGDGSATGIHEDILKEMEDGILCGRVFETGKRSSYVDDGMLLGYVHFVDSYGIDHGYVRNGDEWRVEKVEEMRAKGYANKGYFITKEQREVNFDFYMTKLEEATSYRELAGLAKLVIKAQKKEDNGMYFFPAGGSQEFWAKYREVKAAFIDAAQEEIQEAVDLALKEVRDVLKDVDQVWRVKVFKKDIYDASWCYEAKKAAWAVCDDKIQELMMHSA